MPALRPSARRRRPANPSPDPPAFSYTPDLDTAPPAPTGRPQAAPPAAPVTSADRHEAARLGCYLAILLGVSGALMGMYLALVAAPRDEKNTRRTGGVVVRSYDESRRNAPIGYGGFPVKYEFVYEAGGRTYRLPASESSHGQSMTIYYDRTDPAERCGGHDTPKRGIG